MTFAVYTKIINGVETFAVVEEKSSFYMLQNPDANPKVVWAMCNEREKADIIMNILARFMSDYYKKPFH